MRSAISIWVSKVFEMVPMLRSRQTSGPPQDLTISCSIWDTREVGTRPDINFVSWTIHSCHLALEKKVLTRTMVLKTCLGQE